MDIKKIAVDLALAEEKASLEAEYLTKQLSPYLESIISNTLKPKTSIISYNNIQVPKTILSDDGKGKIDELVIVSSSKDYALEVVADNKLLYDNEWDWFNTITEAVEEMSAFVNGSKFILHLSDIKFTENIMVRLKPTSNPITVDTIFIKLEKY